MRDVAAIVAPAIDVEQIARSILKECIALQDCERRLVDAERKTDDLRKEQARRRVELGRLLIEAKRGIKHGGWGPYLERLGIERQRANEWMRLAGYVEEQAKCPTSTNAGHLNDAPTLAEAGIDKRPRKSMQREEQPDPPLHSSYEEQEDDTQAEVERRAFDVDRELSRWHQKIVAFAEVCPAAARKQIAHELRQMAQTIESIKG